MTAPAPAETLVSTLARKFRLEVNAGTRAAPEWTLVRGITSFNPSIDTNLEDDTDFDSDGWGSQTKTLLSWSLATTVKRGKGVESGTYDPGQEILRRAAESFGAAGVVNVRWYDRDGGEEAYSGDAEVSYANSGDSPTALAMADITLTGKGARQPITNPAAAPAWAATTAYALGLKVTLSGGQKLEATTAGTSGATQPTAPASVGGTVTDGTVTWTRRS